LLVGNHILDDSSSKIIDINKVNFLEWIIKQDLVTILSLLILFCVGSFIRIYNISKIESIVVNKIRQDKFHNTLLYDFEKFEELHVGEILNNLSADAENVGQLIISFFSLFVRSALIAIGGIIFMLSINLKLTFLLFITAIFSITPAILLEKYIKKSANNGLTLRNNFTKFAEITFMEIKTVMALNKQSYFLTKFNHILEEYKKNNLKHAFFISAFVVIIIVSISVSLSVLIYLGNLFIAYKLISYEEFISFFYYSILVSSSLVMISEIFGNMQSQLEAIDRVIIQKPICLTERKTKPITENNLEICFQNVSFCYPSRPEQLILNKLNLNIKAGSLTALVGKSGSGKSTIFQLMVRLYKNFQGKITINNRNINLINDKEIREKILYVDQHPAIFPGSIKDNILLSNIDSTPTEQKQVMEICGIFEIADHLRLGIDTEMGVKGVRISGGQKQRIILARSLLYKPKVLLLDEATNALDINAEKDLISKIRAFLPNTTIIFITHRTHSLMNFDEIIVMENGKIIKKVIGNTIKQDQDIGHKFA